ncbi:hypothetical protein C9J85_12875 [Haloferax sp. wsp5]|nr:hypothetical protein C9J85_12875 [Haloferax sp. wsp5]
MPAVALSFCEFRASESALPEPLVVVSLRESTHLPERRDDRLIREAGDNRAVRSAEPWQSGRRWRRPVDPHRLGVKPPEIRLPGGDSTAERCGVVDVVVQFRGGVVGVLQQCRNRLGPGVVLATYVRSSRGWGPGSTSGYDSAAAATRHLAGR